jgi:serine/threonine-protein kinase
MDAVLSGLAAAHRAGIVHRDVKPENVLLAEDGRIKIGDFGLARATSANTATGQMLLGTIAYLAPELVTRGTADARSDIYALGIMLYEMLVGEQPYKGEQPMQIAYQHATDSVPRPSARNPGIPEQFDELVMWATERNPDDRPVDARDARPSARDREGTRRLPASSERRPPAWSRSTTGPTRVSSPRSCRGPSRPRRSPRRWTTPRACCAVDAERDGADGWWCSCCCSRRSRAGGWWFGSGPGSQVGVPDVSGRTLDEATTALAAEGLTAVPAQDHSRDVPVDLVIRTDPGAGARVDKNSAVNVMISLGPASHDIPALAGQSLQAATTSLGTIYITPSGDPTQIFTDAPAGTVVSASITPPGGGAAVDCSKGCTALEGRPWRSRPPRGPSRTWRQDRGCRDRRALGREPERDDDAGLRRRGRRGPRDPDRGQGRRRTVPPGDTVTLVVSKGPQPIPSPT